MLVRAVGRFQRVLVGFDGSPDAAVALHVAAAFAGRDGGHLVVLCVLPRALHPDGDNERRDSAGLRAKADALLGELVRTTPPEDLFRTSVQIVSSGGDSPGNVVTSYAEEHGFDLLVLGRHGNGGRRKSTLGRVADRAALTCSVPVLLVSGMLWVAPAGIAAQ